MRNKIYYSGFYDIEGSNRMYATPAVVKMNYIIGALNQAGYEVCVLSPSFILKNNGYILEKGGYKNINDNTCLWLPPSIGLRTKLGKKISAFISLLFWFVKILKLSKHDTLIVYHTPIFSKPIRIAKRLKKFNLILEVEEIYTYAFSRNFKKLKGEISLINSADKYILVNDLMSGLLKINPKKSVVCYGPYNMNVNADALVFNDNKIHVVYAGSFSRTKGGVYLAIESAQFLPNKYVIHILGFGNNIEIEDVKCAILNINKMSKCKVIYEGKMTGDEYHSFMKGCKIGLNPQSWGDYMLYAYPSKVLAYLNLGLNVITSPLETLKVSKLNDCLHYIEKESSESLAEKILSIKLISKEEIQSIITNLDTTFIKSLKRIIEN